MSHNTLVPLDLPELDIREALRMFDASFLRLTARRRGLGTRGGDAAAGPLAPSTRLHGRNGGDAS
jgi:hypothetical protein